MTTGGSLEALCPRGGVVVEGWAGSGILMAWLSSILKDVIHHVPSCSVRSAVIAAIAPRSDGPTDHAGCPVQLSKLSTTSNVVWVRAALSTSKVFPLLSCPRIEHRRRGCGCVSGLHRQLQISRDGVLDAWCCVSCFVDARSTSGG